MFNYFIIYFVAMDKQQEIAKLQEVISSLTHQLTEKDKMINQLTTKNRDEQDRQQADDKLPSKLTS